MLNYDNFYQHEKSNTYNFTENVNDMVIITITAIPMTDRAKMWYSSTKATIVRHCSLDEPCKVHQPFTHS